MSSSNTDTDTIAICDACGKEGNSIDMNTCNKCKSVQKIQGEMKSDERDRAAREM